MNAKISQCDLHRRLAEADACKLAEASRKAHARNSKAWLKLAKQSLRMGEFDVARNQFNAAVSCAAASRL